MLEKISVDNSGQAINGAGLNAVLFHRHDCEPSVEMIPVLERYSETRPDMNFFLIQKPCNMPLFERFNITCYPAIVVYRDGQRLTCYDGINDKRPYEYLAEHLDAVRVA